MILEKNEHLNFCKHIRENGQSSLSGIIRRLSITITSDDFTVRVESSHVWSLFVFTNKESNIHFVRRIPKNYRLLKVIDYESGPLWNVPEKLGNSIHLKYSSFRCANVGEVPKSIGLLQNLERPWM
jgi:disease resistance protein RPM1